MINLQKNGAVRRKCTCENKFQDERYGNGIRVMSICKQGAEVRCTVCGTEHRV